MGPADAGRVSGMGRWEVNRRKQLWKACPVANDFNLGVICNSETVNISGDWWNLVMESVDFKLCSPQVHKLAANILLGHEPVFLGSQVWLASSQLPRVATLSLELTQKHTQLRLILYSVHPGCSGEISWIKSTFCVFELPWRHQKV